MHTSRPPTGPRGDAVRRRRLAARLWRGAVAAAAAVTLTTQRRTLLAALRRVGRLSPWWLLAALLAEVVAFALAAELQHRLLRAARVHVSRGFLVALQYASTAISAVVPAGAAVSTGYSYRRLVQRRAPPGAVAWVLAATSIVSVVTLGLLGLVAAILRGFLPLSSTPAVAIVSAGVVVGVASIVATAWVSARGSRLETVFGWFARAVARVRALLRRRARDTVYRADRRDGGAPRSVQRVDAVALSLRGWFTACSLGAANWLADWAALTATFVALGLPIPWLALPWSYLAVQIVGTVPLLGCAGFAEGSMSVALVCAGVRPAHAVAIAVTYRLVSFWTTLPLGLLASRRLARTGAAEPSTYAAAA